MRERKGGRKNVQDKLQMNQYRIDPAASKRVIVGWSRMVGHQFHGGQRSKEKNVNDEMKKKKKKFDGKSKLGLQAEQNKGHTSGWVNG